MSNKTNGKKREEHWPTVMESVEQSIKDLEGIVGERGYSRPTPPVNRLFQLVEKGGLELIVQVK